MSRPVRVEWNGHAVEAVAPAAAAGLRAWADILYDASVEEVPVLTGELRDSAKVTTDDANLEAAVSYNHAYAVKQHEEMDYHHSNGKAKYLEDPLNRTAREGLAALQAEIRRVIG